jgi:hypothetical protein
MVEEQSQLLLAEMPKVNPAWSDTSKVQALKSELADYARSLGFSDEEIGNTVDHRVLITLEKARQHEQAVQKVAPAKKRVSKVPKVMKPGAGKDTRIVNLEATKRARDSLRQSGSIDDALALVRARRG